jgi:hypothetical protein
LQRIERCVSGFPPARGVRAAGAALTLEELVLSELKEKGSDIGGASVAYLAILWPATTTAARVAERGLDVSWFVAQNVGLLYEGKAGDPYCPRQLSYVSGQHTVGSARACSYLYRRSRSPHRRGHLGNAIADRCVQCIEYSFEVMFIYSNQVKIQSIQAKSNRKYLCLIEIANGAAEAKYKNKMLVTAPVHNMTIN